MTKILYDSTIRPEKGLENPDARGLFDFIGDALTILWKDWPKDVQISSFDIKTGRFVLTGECPHGSHTAAFMPVTTAHRVDRPLEDRWVAALECVSCGQFILGIIGMVPEGHGRSGLKYLAHYPLGQPDDTVSPDVPEGIRDDYREALRCRWVKAYKATVLMCRRALQVSCDKEGAQGNDLFHQIDDLAQKQRITDTLKKMAHRIRLLGKKGAHGDYSDIDDTISAKDAEDAVKFMYHYLEHVYILPARLEADAP